MLKVIEFVKGISPEIVTAIIIAFIFWFTRECKKFMKLLNTITAMASDIKEIKGMLPHVFKRLDAQDCSTKELFNALKNQKVNGEAAEAIKLMTEAKKESDDFISGLLFEEKRIV
jgi:hypothetical protein